MKKKLPFPKYWLNLQIAVNCSIGFISAAFLSLIADVMSVSISPDKASAIVPRTDPRLHREVKLIENHLTAQKGIWGVKFLLNSLEESDVFQIKLTFN